jgi:dTDP-4-dehydrorhamnose reductase
VKIVVTGAAGQIGRELVEAMPGAVALDHAALDVTALHAIEAMVAAHRPDVIVHCAAYTNVDGCESDPEHAMRVNGLGPANLVRASDARIIYLSTDYVFDGTKPSPYVESDEPNPQSVYGRSKRAGERALVPDRDTIVRVSLACGAYGNNLVKTILRLLQGDQPLRFVTDQQTRPTIVADLVPALTSLAHDARPGIRHVTNQGTVSPFEFAQAVAKAAGHDAGRIEPVLTSDLPPRPAPRPQNAVLESECLTDSDKLPDFHQSLPKLLAQL